MPPFPPRKPLMNPELRRRGIYLLPNSFTTAALFAGFYAIVQAMNGAFEQSAVARAQLATFEKRLAADPADHQARYDLATALNASGHRAEAAEALLEIIRSQRGWNEDAARLQLLKFFEAWGFDDPATTAARRRLSALLFS